MAITNFQKQNWSNHKNNPNTTMQKLVETFNIHWKMIDRLLVKIGFMRKLDYGKLETHNLTAYQ